MGTMMDILAVGGAVSLFVTPGALVVIVGMGRTLRKLEERNAAQGVTIAGLQARLERSAPVGGAGKASQKRVVALSPIEYGDQVFPMVEDTQPRVWPSAAVEAAAWKDAWVAHDRLKSRQIGTAGRDMRPEIGGSTSDPTFGAVRADFERDCG